MAKVKRVICFYDPNISKDEALTKIWKQKDAMFKVTSYEGNIGIHNGDPLWRKVSDLEMESIKIYGEITPYWAIFENNEFRMSSY